MRLPGDEEPVGSGLPVVYMVVGVSAFVLILLFAILKSNDKQNRGSTYLKELQQQEEMAAAEAEAQSEEPEKKLRAEDLDFWDMYPVEEETEGTIPGEGAARTEKSTFTEKAERVEREEQERKAQSEAEEAAQAQNDPSTDGRHTRIINRDGTEEW